MNKYFLKSAFKIYADSILYSLLDRTLFELLTVVEKIQRLNPIMIIATEMGDLQRGRYYSKSVIYINLLN